MSCRRVNWECVWRVLSLSSRLRGCVLCAVARCSVYCSARLRVVLRTCCALFCMFVLRRYVRLSGAAVKDIGDLLAPPAPPVTY